MWVLYHLLLFNNQADWEATETKLRSQPADLRGLDSGLVVFSYRKLEVDDQNFWLLMQSFMFEIIGELEDGKKILEEHWKPTSTTMFRTFLEDWRNIESVSDGHTVLIPCDYCS